MKILLIGNIGSGKTTIGEILSKKLDLSFITIDNLRRKYSNGTISGEYLALHHFMNECSKQNNILECSGIGCHKHSIKKALENSDEPIFVITIFSELSSIKKRTRNKNWPPHPWSLDLDKALSDIEKELKEDYKSLFWERGVNKIKVIKIINQKPTIIKELIENILKAIKENG